jgi:hypothetical protein
MRLVLMAYGYIKMNICEDMDWFYIAQDEVNWREF